MAIIILLQQLLKLLLLCPQNLSVHNLSAMLILQFLHQSLKENSKNPLQTQLKPKYLKIYGTAALFSVTSHFIQLQKMCKGVAYGINLLENGGLFYKIQPKTCVQLWSLLGQSRCFHSFIQDLLEDVSFCSSWLDLGEEWGSKFLLVHTDYRMYFLVLVYTSHCTTSYPATPSGLKTSTLVTC